MIHLKTAEEAEKMKIAGSIAGRALRAAAAAVAPGVTTAYIDKIVRDTIESLGAYPSFLGYGGFKGSACVSINDEVIHGIPGKKLICAGDLVKVDVGACKDGFHGDCAGTFYAGEVSQEAKHLAEVTRQSFYEGIKYARVGYRISDISAAIQEYAEKNGCSVVRQYVGHGVGEKLHEDPEVPNFGKAGHGPRLLPGMTIAIEPMLNAGTYDVTVLPDGWTVKTADKRLSAHFEHSVLITNGDPVLLTEVRED